MCWANLDGSLLRRLRKMSTIFAIVWVKNESCLGSSSERVIRLSRVPVWVCRGRNGHLISMPIHDRKIGTYFEGRNLKLGETIGGERLQRELCLYLLKETFRVAVLRYTQEPGALI